MTRGCACTDGVERRGLDANTSSRKSTPPWRDITVGEPEPHRVNTAILDAMAAEVALIRAM
jgi:hypothetical protein